MDSEPSDQEARELSRKFADELHDGPMQWLVGAKMQVEAMIHGSQEGHPPDSAALERLLGTLQSGIRSARQLMQGWLHPPLRDGHWHAALQDQLQTMVSSLPGPLPELHFQLDRDTEPLSHRAATLVVAVLREAIWNAIRYSQATQIKVTGRRASGQLELQVEDDGQGFLLSEEPRASRGVAMIQERANELGGTARLSTTRGRGTRWQIVIPNAE